MDGPQFTHTPVLHYPTMVARFGYWRGMDANISLTSMQILVLCVVSESQEGFENLHVLRSFQAGSGLFNFPPFFCGFSRFK